MDYSSFKSEASPWPYGSKAQDTQAINVLGNFPPTRHGILEQLLGFGEMNLAKAEWPVNNIVTTN